MPSEAPNTHNDYHRLISHGQSVHIPIQAGGVATYARPVTVWWVVRALVELAVLAGSLGFGLRLLIWVFAR